MNGRGIFFPATANPVPQFRAPAFPPLPHRLRDPHRLSGGMEGVESRARRSGGRGEGVTAPALALPPRPGLRGRTACFQEPWLQQNRCHGRTHWAPAPEALSLRPPRVKARHAVPPQIASRLRSRRLVREPPALQRRLCEPTLTRSGLRDRKANNGCGARHGVTHTAPAD